MLNSNAIARQQAPGFGEKMPLFVSHRAGYRFCVRLRFIAQRDAN